MDYAPIVIFGFDRPLHLNNMIESLSHNTECIESDAYIFIDGPTEKVNQENYEKVLEVTRGELPFKNSFITIREKNLQCKNNIIQGITEVIENKGRAIIMEDDLIVSNQFLHYMNHALEEYKDNKDV